MFPSPENLERLALPDIHTLIAAKIPEGLSIDYKRDFYAEIREWCKDALAFANGVGGCVLLGVDEVDSLPVAVPGVPSAGVEAALGRMENGLRDQTEPRLRMHCKRLPIDRDREVVVVGIARSSAGPHRRSDGKWYKRSATGHNNEMDMTELRRAFAGSLSMEEQVQAVHSRRVAEWEQRQGHGIVLLLDVVPLPADEERFNPGDEKQRDAVCATYPGNAWALDRHRIAFDGLVFAHTESKSAQMRFQRNGAVRVTAFWESVTEQKAIAQTEEARRLVAAVHAIYTAQRAVKIMLPTQISMSLTRCHGYRFASTQRAYFPPAIDMNTLSFSPLFVEHPPTTIEETRTVLQPLLDRLWNAGGENRCHPLFPT